MDEVTITCMWTTTVTFEVPNCFEVKEDVEFDDLPQDWKDELLPTMHNTDLYEVDVS